MTESVSLSFSISLLPHSVHKAMGSLTLGEIPKSQYEPTANKKKKHLGTNVSLQIAVLIKKKHYLQCVKIKCSVNVCFYEEVYNIVDLWNIV